MQEELKPLAEKAEEVKEQVVQAVEPARSFSGYCVKCRKKREIANPQNITMANGRQAIKGTCPVCGTGMFVIGKRV